MLQLSNHSYACWRWLSRSRGRLESIQSIRSPAINYRRSTLPELQRYWASSQSAPLKQGRHDQPSISKLSTQEAQEQDDYLPIRERLRSWIKHNEQKLPDDMPQDTFIYGSVSNNLTRTQSTGSSEMDQLRSTRGGMTDDPEGDQGNADTEVSVVGVGSRRPGDLVELRATSSRVPLFAVYLGFFGERNHFYAANGRWITGRGFSSLFTATNFATSAELAPLMAEIPRNASPEQFDELRRQDKGPSREDGSRLIDRMTEVRHRAEAVYQANLEKLDAVRALLSSQKHIRHLSLLEIADVLLPASLKKDGVFPAYALYAVHTALSRSEIGFRPLNPSSDCHRQDNLIEILPQNHTLIIEKVATLVRDYTESSKNRLRPLTPAELEQTVLGRFILQARKAIRASRLQREWSSHGVLKPSLEHHLPQTKWSQPSKEIIAFLEWWASYDLFESGSRFHNYGALILRALQVYDENAALDQSTAWTFLQEAGIISPWEIPSRYRVRFPDVTIQRGGGLEREPPKSIEESKRQDIALGFRREHNQATIFCIDASSTIVIDDGISLERTNKPDEFWLHVHAADPASSIEPNSNLSRFMELIPENIYLPGHFQAMLPSELGEDELNDLESESLIKQFSLKSGSPALTFSAKVNDAGDILDFKVEPSTLGNVVYLDPKDVSELCNEPAPPPVPTTTLAVGSPIQDEKLIPNRDMIATKDLDALSKEDLLVMYRLGEAIRKKRLSKGAWPYFFPRPSVSVSFPEKSEEGSSNEELVAIPADPYIKVDYETSMGCSVVSSLMVLAGQIAARWCSYRGIPVPYRRDVKHAQGSKKAYEYATTEIYPLISQGIEPSINQRQELSRLTGGIEISSRPGSYFLLGLDMYVKATSPLRRFSDLLVHWQIHAALEHEREIKRAIDPGFDNLDEILPFSEAQLAGTLPLLQMREKMARTVSRGVLEWILMALVRAWRFDKSAPTSFRFTVGSRFKQGVLGRIDLFDLNAAMDVAGLDGRALIKDVQVGDQFEVELADVNVHSRQVAVKALRYLGSSANGSGAPTAPA
ncbi:Mitochondrial protein cyt-4 [Cladobotryum mycophilum]|uniref:Mitochondrial protein cyt-4 n=1 Tax=Cladobotryum mycophilum TaxID=491253 RepID=A0ABR0S6Y9_9HYPO